MTALHTTVSAVTERIRDRSASQRRDYLDLMTDAMATPVQRSTLGCGNLAHGFAACGSEDKDRIRLMNSANIGIITAYNDMLSAHQPYATYPEQIKAYLRAVGSTAQVAGGVPAMCDGVTQGMAGMELSLFSRDVIAQATAISLSHQMFDGVLCLGICDKIVPGMLMGALRFGHLPTMFVPAGPMHSGLANAEKARIRQLYAEGKIGRDELLAGEAASYHSPGTCTFYGTANSNQVLMEAMGLQLPGSSFVNPDLPLRAALTQAACEQINRITALGDDYRPLAQVIDERSVVNAIVALLASGGSTNHSIHLVAIARAAGILINWNDFDDLSQVVPLLARVYPNGQADINHFHAAGGTSYMFRELLVAGFMHGDANTVWGETISAYTQEPILQDGKLHWREGVVASLDASVLASTAQPFDVEGGLRLLQGNLGRAIIKVSAVKPEHRVVRAQAVVLSSQQNLQEKFAAGELNRDCVVVVRFQGPKANGMPELHKLTPVLGILQDKGFKVALVTDGRMSGASGKVPAAIQVTPEARDNGPLALVQDGDWITVDAIHGVLYCEVAEDEWQTRSRAVCDDAGGTGVGRELFANFRRIVTSAEQGASVLFE